MVVRELDARASMEGRPEKYNQIEKRAYRINEFCTAYGLGRTKVYELIKSGKLRTVLVAGRRLVPRDAADALLAGTDVS
jgi:excisionase family DNA binding protein